MSEKYIAYIVKQLYLQLFDEAQRAWDEEAMEDYGISEPELIMRVQNQATKNNGYTNNYCLYWFWSNYLLR